METSQPRKNHHFVAKLLLKGFADKSQSNFIWQYARGQEFKPGRHPNLNPFFRSIKSAGAESCYYSDPTVPCPEGIDRYEKILEALEKPSNIVFDKLRAQNSLTRGDKETFAQYIIQANLRSPLTRKLQAKLVPDQVDNFDLFELERVLKTESRIAEAKELLIKFKHDEDYQKSIHLRMLNAKHERIFQRLMDMNWRFYVAADASFVASDVPIYISRDIGLRNRRATVTMPISSKIALLCSYAEGEDLSFAHASSKLVIKINKCTASGAQNFLYYHAAEQWVWKLLRNKHIHSSLRLYPKAGSL